MGMLRIIASGASPKAEAQARGKLFEKLAAEVLRHCGFKIDSPPNINYAGMEIDIEGRGITTGTPLYAECKCLETDVDSPRFQAFLGKYFTRWRKDNRCQGLFIALPGVNGQVKGLYRDEYEHASDTTVRLLEEEHVLQAIFDTNAAASPDVVRSAVDPAVGRPGDCLLLYTDRGLFWVQYVIPEGEGIPTKIGFFDSIARPVVEKATVEYLTRLCPELGDFERIDAGGSIELGAPTRERERGQEEIVETRGSSARFEYQFPASPQYFIGRQYALAEIDAFVRQVVEKKTSSRGLLFEANSGWGKSSLVLATAARLRGQGHLVVPIDSRSASSSQFVLRVIDYALKRTIPSISCEQAAIGGFDDASAALIQAGRKLENASKILLIFLDQFENVFFLPDALSRIAGVFLKLCDSQTNIILGFSWKSDLIGLTNEFPYRTRDTLLGASKRISLQAFSEIETNALLDRLAEELHSSLRKDLRFLLSDFGQGYPWLLTKLCAHVKAQREAGVKQADIANSLLNVDQLFQEDLRGLSAEEDETLHRIARVAPITVSELGEDFKADVLQALVDRRLLVRIGTKYDVYWDIFRDYLNSGSVPIQENYILRTQPVTVLQALRLLADTRGLLTIAQFREATGFTKGSFYNVLRDMRLLGLAETDDGTVSLQPQFKLANGSAQEFEESIRVYLRDRLQRNRFVQRLMQQVEIEGILTAGEVSDLLMTSCPYIAAGAKTWQTYRRIFADWMDRADLVRYDAKDGTLARYLPSAVLTDRRSLLARRRVGIPTPCIQYGPIEEMLLRVHDAVRTRAPIERTGFAKTTREKALVALDDLGFIKQKKATVAVFPDVGRFAENPDGRKELFAAHALQMQSFATFVDILREHEQIGATLAHLAGDLKSRLRVGWAASTAETNVKIMLNWARHAGLASGTFATPRLRPSTKMGALRQQGDLGIL